MCRPIRRTLDNWLASLKPSATIVYQLQQCVLKQTAVAVS